MLLLAWDRYPAPRRCKFAHTYMWYVHKPLVCRFATDGTVPLDMEVPITPPRNTAEMAYCESAYQVISIWLWLSMRFAEAFPNRHVAQVCSCVQKPVHGIRESIC